MLDFSEVPELQKRSLMRTFASMRQRLAQQLLVQLVRPYIAAELPKWGLVYEIMIGSYKRNAFWSNAPKVRGRNKFFGFESEYDLRLWADRISFFLGRWYDLPSQLLISAVRGKIIVDVGANRGDFSLAAAGMDSAARIIAFEPNPAIAAILRRDAEHNRITNVEVRECGLSDREDVLPLYVPFVNSGSASFGGFESEGYVIEDIPVRIGDQQLRHVQPDLIKIDVEGLELRVLQGLRKTIEASRPIIEIELIDENLARCHTSRREIESFMLGLGYRGFGLGLARNGREHELLLDENIATSDVVWLPLEIDPHALRASTRDFRNLALKTRGDRPN